METDYDEKGLERFLRDRLKGKRYDTYIAPVEVTRTIAFAFPEEARGRLEGNAVYGDRPQYIGIRYLGRYVCYIQVRKKKTDRARYGGTEFAYDDFEVAFEGGGNVHTARGAIMAAEADRLLREQKEKEDFERYLKAYRFLKDSGLAASVRAASSFLSEASKAAYRHIGDPKFEEIFGD